MAQEMTKEEYINYLADNYRKRYVNPMPEHFYNQCVGINRIAYKIVAAERGWPVPDEDDEEKPLQVYPVRKPPVRPSAPVAQESAPVVKPSQAPLPFKVPEGHVKPVWQKGVPPQNVTSQIENTNGKPKYKSIAESTVKIIGQDHAMNAIDDVMESGCLGLTGGKGKPLATFLIAGPSGVGKTETAKAIAECLYGSKDAMVRMNMNEHSGGSATWHAFGAVRGYESSGEGGELIKGVQKHNGRCVVLIDECEKGGQEFLRALMTALDEGYLEHRRTGEKIKLDNAVVIMTTNAMGDVSDLHAMHEGEIRKQLLGRVIDNKQLFLPEFIGRIQKVIGYRSLQCEELSEILIGRYMRESVPRIREGLGIEITGVNFDVAVMIAKAVQNSPFGVRELDNMIYQHLVRPLKRLGESFDKYQRYFWCQGENDSQLMLGVEEPDEGPPLEDDEYAVAAMR